MPELQYTLHDYLVPGEVQVSVQVCVRPMGPVWPCTLSSYWDHRAHKMQPHGPKGISGWRK